MVEKLFPDSSKKKEEENWAFMHFVFIVMPS